MQRLDMLLQHHAESVDDLADNDELLGQDIGAEEGGGGGEEEEEEEERDRETERNKENNKKMTIASENPTVS